MDSKAARTFYEHARWLLDRQAVRQASIESRSTALVGWSSAQIALTLGVIALASRVDGNGWRTGSLWVLGAATAALTAAVVIAVSRVLRTQRLTAPNVDLSTQWQELKAASGEEVDTFLLEALIGSLLAGDDTEPTAALTSLADAIDTRGRWLRSAAYFVAAAVVLDALAGLLLVRAITV